MKPVVIIGTGGHAREVAEIVQAMHAAGRCGPLLGFLTDAHDQHGQTVLGVAVLGAPEWLAEHTAAAIIAIGDNATRRRIAGRIDAEWLAAISPHAIISPHAVVQPGAMIFPGAVLGPLAVIGAHSIVNVGASVSHDSVVGDWANLNPGARIAGNVRVGAGASIGMGASIIQGRAIGPWAVIGAGAAVVRDIPGHVTAVGVPARVRG
jgi:sugar O-acyltransferase (sialic acid O-acetyltransferase NeuD family)